MFKGSVSLSPLAISLVHPDLSWKQPSTRRISKHHPNNNATPRASTFARSRIASPVYLLRTSSWDLNSNPLRSTSSVNMRMRWPSFCLTDQHDQVNFLASNGGGILVFMLNYKMGPLDDEAAINKKRWFFTYYDQFRLFSRYVRQAPWLAVSDSHEMA